MRLFQQIIGGRRSLRPLAQADHDELLGELVQWPAASAFLLGWLHRFGMSGTRKNSFFDVFVMGPSGDWSLVALVVHGALVSIVHGDEEAGRTLGTYLRGKGQTIQTVVGIQAAVDGVVATLMPPDFEARVVQDQVLMMRERTWDAEKSTADRYDLRIAAHEDISRLSLASLQMHEEEVQSPNTEADIDALIRSTYQKVQEERAWVLTDVNGGIVFKASTSLPNPTVAQIEGVWTNPQARQRGIGFACMQQICAQLFQSYERISLTVAATNSPAIRIYEGLGFRRISAWKTVYLDPPDPSSEG